MRIEAVLLSRHCDGWLVATRGPGFWLLKFWSETEYTNERKPHAGSIEPGDVIKIPEFDMFEIRSIDDLSTCFEED